MAWLATILIPISIGSLVLLLPLIFPDGRPLSRRWGVATWLVLTFLVIATTLNAVLSSYTQSIPVLPNPFQLTVPVWLREGLANISPVMLLGTFGLCVMSIVLRFRRAGGEERSQITWLIYAILIWSLTIIVATVVEFLSPELFPIFDGAVYLTLLGLPLSIGVAVLRYRLYNIDLLINRTLVYGVLSTLLVAGYVALVSGLGAVLAARNSPLVGLIATGIVAVLFQPLRERVQRAINRLLYGERDEPYAALSRLGTRLETALAPEAVLPTLVQTVAESLRLPYVALALPLGDGGLWEVVAAHGTPTQPSPADDVVPLVYQGEPVGQLRLSPRRGAPFTAADQRLLRELARQAGAAVYSVRLTAELRRSRERLVTVQEDERRRIQRDLHDGLGPTLASMRFRIESCLDRAQSMADLGMELERLDELVGQAAADIRRLVNDLRPPALDQLGLAGALRQHSERVKRETKLDVQLNLDIPPHLPAALEVTLFRVVQEALVNVTKYAQATRVIIRLSPLGAALLLHIHDDGVGGAAVGRTGHGGHGLAGIAERVELLGGNLSLQSVPGSGTTLELYLPLRENYDEHGNNANSGGAGG